jgi:hypothetical protein
MHRFEKTLRRHRPPPTESWIDPVQMPLRMWVQLFFVYCVAHHLSFYWEWDGFLVVALFNKSKKLYSVHVHVDRPQPPYLETLDYTFESPYLASLLPFLMHLYDRYPSTFLATRNRQASVRHLSFYTFLVQWKVSEKEFEALTKAVPAPMSQCLFKKEYSDLSTLIKKSTKKQQEKTWSRSELLALK